MSPSSAVPMHSGVTDSPVLPSGRAPTTLTAAALGWCAPPRGPRAGSTVRQLIAQGLADRAVGERERVRERDEVVLAQAAEELGVLLDQRLREGDVDDERAHPVEAPPRIGIEVGRLARDEVLHRSRDLGV